MRAGESSSLLAVVVDIGVSLALFAGLFVAIFWTPGLLLAAFAVAYASDPRSFSHALGRDRRRREIALAARRHRGGWLDSPARID